MTESVQFVKNQIILATDSIADIDRREILGTSSQAINRKKTNFMISYL